MKYRYVLEFETTREIAPADLATLQTHLDVQLESLADGDYAEDFFSAKSSMLRPWTLERFVATRERHEDIGAAVGEQLYDERGEPCVCRGLLYAGRFFIQIDADGQHTLTLENDCVTVPGAAWQVDALEQKLFDFVSTHGLLDDEVIS